jgi:hypothetical protein
MVHKRILAIPFVLIVGFAGCVSPNRPNAGAATVPTVAHNHASLVIHIPRHIRTKHRARFVSPSTQSASITIAPAGGCAGCSPTTSQQLGLTPASPNCAPDTNGTACTMAFVLSPGNYIGTIVTYDGPLSAQGQPTGNVLSLDQSFPVPIVAGAANVLSLALFGVPASIAFLNLSAATLAIAAKTSPATLPTFYVAAGSTARFQAFAMDTDGNVILGPGAPTFTALANDGFSAASNGNTIVLTPPALVAGSSGSLAITASSPGCSAPGATCIFSENVAFDSVVAIANTGTNAVAILPQLAILAGKGTPYATIRSGISGPVAEAFQSLSGNLFVSNSVANTVTEYAPPYTGAPIATISTGLNKPGAIALALNGELAVANTTSDTVEMYAPPYTGAPVTITLLAAPERPNALAFDVSNNVWVAISNGNFVIQYTAPSYNSVVILLNKPTNSINTPSAIALDLSENLYVANAGELDEYNASSSYSGTPSASATGLSGISALSISGQSEGAYIAACYSGGVNVYHTGGPPMTVVDGKTTTSACLPAFDRRADLTAVFPSTSGASAYAFLPGVGWDTGSSFTSSQLSAPTAVAEWP